MKETVLSYLPGAHPWQNRILWYDSVGSTNTLAKELAAQGAPHGTVLIADSQTGGRGRMGRSFQSPPGLGIYLSVLLRYPCRPDALMHLTCAAAAAMCSAVETATGLRPGIKWTNDLVHGRRKLGGILTELLASETETCAIVGIGLNCCQSPADFGGDIRDFAGSLAMAAGGPVDRAKVAAAMICSLWEMDKTLFSGKNAMLEAYRAACITTGREISLLRGEEVRHGFAESIDGSGGLIVRFPDGHRETVQSGEVSIRGMYGYI